MGHSLAGQFDADAPWAKNGHARSGVGHFTKGNRVAVKQSITEAELTKMLMREFRKHPQCDHITGVAIKRRAGRRQWWVAFVRDGSAVTCPEAIKIVAEFQRKYDIR